MIIDNRQNIDELNISQARRKDISNNRANYKVVIRVRKQQIGYAVGS